MTDTTKVATGTQLRDISELFTDFDHDTISEKANVTWGSSYRQHREPSITVSEDIGWDAPDIYNTLLRIQSTTRFLQSSRSLLTLCKTSAAKLIIALALWKKGGFHEINTSRCEVYSFTTYSPVYRYLFSDEMRDGASPTIRPTLDRSCSMSAQLTTTLRSTIQLSKVVMCAMKLDPRRRLTNDRTASRSYRRGRRCGS
jgi:hypothetical protein